VGGVPWPEVRDLARHLAAVDALLAFATVAADHGWVGPEVNEGTVLKISGGRHSLMEQPGTYQTNDAYLDAATLINRAEHGGQEHLDASDRTHRGARVGRLVGTR
jgi:hypothetical protein